MSPENKARFRSLALASVIALTAVACVGHAKSPDNVPPALVVQQNIDSRVFSDSEYQKTKEEFWRRFGMSPEETIDTISQSKRLTEFSESEESNLDIEQFGIFAAKTSMPIRLDATTMAVVSPIINSEPGSKNVNLVVANGELIPTEIKVKIVPGSNMVNAEREAFAATVTDLTALIRNNPGIFRIITYSGQRINQTDTTGFMIRSGYKWLINNQEDIERSALVFQAMPFLSNPILFTKDPVVDGNDWLDNLQYAGGNFFPSELNDYKCGLKPAVKIEWLRDSIPSDYAVPVELKYDDVSCGVTRFSLQATHKPNEFIFQFKEAGQPSPEGWLAKAFFVDGQDETFGQEGTFTFYDDAPHALIVPQAAMYRKGNFSREMPLRRLRIVYPDKTFNELYFGQVTKDSELYDKDGGDFFVLDHQFVGQPALIILSGGMSK